MPATESDLNENAESAIARVLEGSRVVDAVQRARAATGSRLRAVGDRAASVVRESFVYRWLTAEPDPEVVVIDLRETYTVGPFITVLDRVVDALAPIYRQSRFKRGVDALAGLLERAADTRPGRVLVALFEPPEPPDDHTASEPPDDHTDDGDDAGPPRVDGEDEASDRDAE